MESFEIWAEGIYKEIKNNSNKKIILISGASGSGKSFNAEKLEAYLNKKGIKASSFSADNYYKGIARMLVEKALKNNPELNKHEQIKHKIIEKLKNIIKFSPFTEKFNSCNQEKIFKVLQPIIKKDTEKFCNALLIEFQNINFDEPFALDLNLLLNDINKLISNQEIILPSYSFATGEVEFDKNNCIGNDFNVFIIEGLYTLRDEVFGNIDKNYVIPCFIDCNLKSLLSRRLNRDIKSGRTTFSPEQTIVSTLTKVMPSYCTYIEPYKKNSQFTLTTSLSENEILQKEDSEQLKFKLTQLQLNALNKLCLKQISTCKQNDYYFDDNIENNSFILRLRIQDGAAHTLTFKNSTNSAFEINRKIDEYALSQFNDIHKLPNFFINSITNSGFKNSIVINKTRTVYQYNKTAFKVDYVEKLGCFIEFDSLNADTKYIINLLKLTDIQNTSYFEILSSQTSTKHIEKEYKFKINKIPDKYDKKQEIYQFYFNFLQNKKYLLKIFPNINEESVKSARVRIIKENNDVQYYLTLKSDGNFERYEQEFLINKKIVENLIKTSYSYIKKTRYILNKNGLCFEFDQYNNGLKIAEIEVADESSYDLIVQTLNNLGLSYIDVTNQTTYKNQNLAKSINKNIHTPRG